MHRDERAGLRAYRFDSLPDSIDALVTTRDEVTTDSVIGLSALRVLDGDETAFGPERQKLDLFGLGDAVTEFDAMDGGLRRAFDRSDAPSERANTDDASADHERWKILTYTPGADAAPAVTVVAAPARSATQRANTASTCRWLAEHERLLQRGQSVLIVTTHHYRPFQLADAMREFGAALDLTVDAYAMAPGDYDHRLVFRPTTGDLLQEIRSTIRAYRDLAISLGADEG